MPSVDEGRTWEPVSRQGQSDFHALAAGEAGILGYDGSLVHSTDGVAWRELQIPVRPAALAASPTGHDVLAATGQRLLHSPDSGSTWSPSAGVPVFQTVACAADGATVVGVEPAGTLWTSADGAVTWQEGPGAGTPGPGRAVAATADGKVPVAAVTTEGVLVSEDSGRTFDAVLEW